MISDVMQALRALRRAPGLTLLTVTILGLGIGLATTAFSFANAVFLRPLPFQEPERLVLVESWRPGGTLQLRPHEREEVEAAASFESVASYATDIQVVAGPAGALQARVARVQPSLWRTLGVPAALGRTFGAEEAGRGASPVVVLSHGYWRSRFGSDPGAVGRELRLDDEVATVVGVMPEGFAFPERAALWLPLGEGAEAGSFQLVARLRDGVSQEQAAMELDVIAARLARHRGDVEGEQRLVLLDEVIYRARGVGRLPWFAVTVAVLVLLIACSNIAGLLLVRSVRRRGEMAIRSAIGGSRGRLVRHLLLETAVLGTAGALVGALVALHANDLIRRLLWRMPEWIELAVDGRVLAFVAGTVLFIVAAVGLAPAFEATRVNVTAPLRGAAFGTTESARSRRLGSVQAVLQLAFAFVLVLGAAVLGRSFAEMTDLDFGVDADRVLQVRVEPIDPALREDPAERALFARRVAADARAVAGVGDVAIDASPIRLLSQPDSAFLKDRPNSLVVGGERYAVNRLRFDAVTPNYFEVMGVAMREGRPFQASDTEGGEPVAVLSRAVADRVFPEGSAVGRTIRFRDEGPVVTVVGVAADQFTFYSGRRGLRGEAMALVYIPFDQAATDRERILARTLVPPVSVVARLGSALDRPEMPVGDQQVRTIADERATTLRLVAWAGGVLGMVAVAALGLALLGLYGVIAFRAAQRTREIGIRRALGADAGAVLRMMLRAGGSLALKGLAVAAPLVFLMGTVIGDALYEVSPTDPVALLVTAGLFFGTALLATWIPARRAARVDPSEALRDVG